MVELLKEKLQKTNIKDAIKICMAIYSMAFDYLATQQSCKEQNRGGTILDKWTTTKSESLVDNHWIKIRKDSVVLPIESYLPYTKGIYNAAEM